MGSVTDIDERSVSEYAAILAITVVRERCDPYVGGICEAQNGEQSHRHRSRGDAALGTGSPLGQHGRKRTILPKRRKEKSAAVYDAGAVPGDEPCHRRTLANDDR
ncbi:MAG: hypothetical protein PXZ07_11255 [Candidatus Eremiobacteraeota bacterium]|nr:hypothetical protein [Candidatus Eremiobacteraeota bacterium]